MIQIQNVTFSYSNRTRLLADLSLTLQTGRIHGLLGKNGEGKSTLLKLMSGLVFPKSGNVDVMGFVPAARKPEMLSEIFFLPEELPVLNISVQNLQNVYAPFYPNFDAQLFDKFLNEFDVQDKKAMLTRLSHGQKKKVMIAFGLATNTKLLLMDEPTNGLDIPSKAQFRRMVASVIDDNRCMVISTHQVHDLDGLIDSITIMDRHEIVFNRTLEEISQKLCFRMADRNQTDEKVIYCEDTLRGQVQVCVNTTGEESKVDIEMLFSAVLANKSLITSLFK